MLNRSANLGLLLTPSGVSMSFAEKGGKVIQQEDVTTPIDFETSHLKGLASAIQTLVQRFPKRIMRADNNVCLALPDTCFQQSELEFDEFPRRKSEALDLVAWRHCDELSLDASDVAVGYRKAVTVGTGKTSVFAQSIPKEIVASCEDALWQSSLVPGQIDSLGSYLMTKRGSKKQKGWGAVFWYSKDWWSFRVINKYGEMEPQFGAWNKNERDGDLIARRFKRVLSIYEKQAEDPPHFLNMVGMKEAEIEQVEKIAQGMNINIERTAFADLQGLSKIVATAR